MPKTNVVDSYTVTNVNTKTDFPAEIVIKLQMKYQIQVRYGSHTAWQEVENPNTIQDAYYALDEYRELTKKSIYTHAPQYRVIEYNVLSE